jgi:hypothetical protein
MTTHEPSQYNLASDPRDQQANLASNLLPGHGVFQSPAKSRETKG